MFLGSILVFNLTPLTAKPSLIVMASLVFLFVFVIVIVIVIVFRKKRTTLSQQVEAVLTGLPPLASTPPTREKLHQKKNAKGFVKKIGNKCGLPQKREFLKWEALAVVRFGDHCNGNQNNGNHCTIFT